MLQNFDLFKASDFKCVRHNKKIKHVNLDTKADKRIFCSDCTVPSTLTSLKEIDEIISKQTTNVMAQKTEADILNVSNHVNGLLTHEIDKVIDHFNDALNKFRYVLKKQYQILIEEELKEKTKRRIETLNSILKTFWTNGKIEDGKYLEKYIQTYQELTENNAKTEQFRGFCDQNLHELSTKMKSLKEELKKKIEEFDHLFSNREAICHKIFGQHKMTNLAPKKSKSNNDEEEKFDETLDLSEIRCNNIISLSLIRIKH